MCARTAHSTHMRGISFDTQRFALRSLTTEDVSARYQSWFNAEIASMGVSSARRQPSLDELRAFVGEREDREDVLFLGIFTKADGTHIGNLKYEPISRDGGYAVLGILIGDKAWWGKGVATEVLRPTAHWLRERYGIREIVLGVMKDNALALRGYEKVGFRAEPSPYIKYDVTLHECMVWHLDESAA